MDDYTGRMNAVMLLDWNKARPLVAPLRLAVFVVEQGVPEDMEWDEMDACSTHAAVLEADKCIGTARLLPISSSGEASIGRMAVRQDRRRQGVGRLLLQCLLEEAGRQGARRVRLHAQLTAVDFYRRAGFVDSGVVFEEAGLMHVAMGLELNRR